MGFSQKCWPTVKEDVMLTLKNFHFNEYFEKSLNASYVALIPKKNEARELKDFRPISLIGSVYKIIAKVLTERLKTVINKLIGGHQMAFIKGRQIMDASLIANEVVDSRLKSKIPGVLCKLDIEKAYDHVNRKFLLRLIKGVKARGSFIPFLFLMAMEGLNQMINTAKSNGWIKGFKVFNRQNCSLEISHLLYADDSIIFMGTQPEEMLHLRLILTTFEAVAGLHVNWGKSIRNQKAQNNSLLAKWLCRYNLEETALWRRVIQEKYGHGGPWCTKPVSSPYGVCVWKTIRGQWRFIADHSSIKVGNGRRVLFWCDTWFGHTPLNDQFPDLYNIAANPRISVAEAKSTRGWNIVFRRNLNDWELQSVAEFWETLEAFHGLTEEEDVLMWKGHKLGVFSVKSAYHFFNTTTNPTQGWPWKQTWRVRAPTKVLCFTWLVVREAVLTQDNLIRRGIQLQARCSLCGKDGESASHLFIHCPVTTQLWHLYLHLAGISWTMPNNTTSLLSSWNNGGANIKQKKW
nr:uncharacterized protein LOC104095219 [Nicotiana tomentosiformis]